MREITIIGAFGLSDDQLAVLKKNIPTVNCEIMDTESFTDIIAHSEIANVVIWDKLSDDDKSLLIDFYTEIAPFSETMVLIGDVDIPRELRNCVAVYSSFDHFAENAKYILLGAHRKTKRDKEFSKTLANCLKILSLLRKKQYITTREMAEELELSKRTIQRYIETLRVAREWIEYDANHRGWYLAAKGKSILWGDVFDD